MAWTFSSRVTGGEPLLTLGPFPSVLVCLSDRNPGPSVVAAPSFDLSLASGRVTIHIVSTARANARRPTVCARELAAHGQEMPPAWVVRSAGEMQGLGRDMASRDAGGGLRNVIPNPLREIPNERSPTEEKPPLDRNPVPLTTPTDTGVGMNQYGRLTGFLLNQPSTEVTVTFAEMEDQEKIGISLPSAAKRSVRWWENESARDARQSRAWMDAGWEVARMDLSAQRITFRRRSSTPR